MGLLEASDLICRIAVGPSVTHSASLWYPEVHSPRTCYRRIGVSDRKRMFGHRTNENTDMTHWIHIIHFRLTRTLCRSKKSNRKYYFLYILNLWDINLSSVRIIPSLCSASGRCVIIDSGRRTDKHLPSGRNRVLGI